MRIWVVWGQKLGRRPKTKEKLINMLEAIFLKQSSCLVQNLFLDFWVKFETGSVWIKT